MKDFKIGDWVYISAINENGKVIGGYLDTTWNENSYHVRMEDGRELDVLESNCKLADCDPKTAFLTEWQSLLRRYNACLWVQGGTDANLIISLNGDESEIPNMCGVNADNIDIIKNKI